MDVRANKLLDYKIGAEDGHIGSVDDVLFDDHEWCVRYLVVSTGPWLFGRKVLVEPSSITGIDTATELVNVSLTTEQIKNGPDIEIDPPMSRDQQIQMHDYYNWPIYWGAGATLGSASLASGGGNVYLAGNTRLEPSPNLPPADDRDPYLRSAKEVAGYKLANDEQELGKLDDLVVDTESWKVDAAIMELDKPDGKRIVLPVRRIDVVGTDDIVGVNLSGQTLEDAPAYDSDGPLEDDLVERARSYFKAKA